MAKTGVYQNDWFNLTGVEHNIPKLYTYISKGAYTSEASCTGRTFERNGIEHSSHFERTYITLTVTKHSFRTETGVLSTKGFDVLLPHNVRMPIEKKEYTDNRLGILVWPDKDNECDANTGFTNQFVELYQGDVDLHLKRDTTVETKYDNALVTVYTEEKKKINSLPVTFGYSVRYKTNVCSKVAYQTNGSLLLAKHSVSYVSPSAQKFMMTFPFLSRTLYPSQVRKKSRFLGRRSSAMNKQIYTTQSISRYPITNEAMDWVPKDQVKL